MHMGEAGVILVLGMHRSGTSMLTAGLPALGIDLGTNLMPARPGDNDKGYFENPDIVALNEELLAVDGHHWASLAHGAPLDYGAERYAALRRRAAEVLADQFGPGPIALKDPRLCITLPFWQQVIAAARPGAEVLHLHLFRHPAAVAASFAARARRPEMAALVAPIGDDREQAMLLWLSYTYQALRDSLGRRNWCLQHQALLDDPATVLTALATALGLAADARGLDDFAHGFIDPRLIHHRGERPIAEQQARLGFIDALWPRLSRLDGPLPAAAHEQVLAAFPNLEFAYLWCVQAGGWSDAQQRAARLEAELFALQEVVQDRDERLRTLYAERDAARMEAARNAAERDALQTAVDVREQKLIDLYAERDQLRSALERRRPDLWLKRLYRRLRGG